MLKVFGLSLLFFTSSVVLAQQMEEVANITDAMSDASRQRRAFKVLQPSQDKVEIVEVTGVSQTSYLVSNVVDGTANSYEHATRIVILLQAPAYKMGSVQMVFYSPQDKIRQAAENENGSIQVFYPIAMYESVRSRMEQALAARKKVTLKVTQKTTGYREGVLVF